MTLFRFRPQVEDISRRLQPRIDRARANPEHDGSDFSDVADIVALLADRDRQLEDFMSRQVTLAGSTVGTTSAGGDLTIIFNPAFPQTPVSVVVSNGDAAASGNAWPTVLSWTRTAVVVRWFVPAGVAAALVCRTNWVAVQ